MGSSKKHKEKDRERSHKKKHRHRSRSRSREKKAKRQRKDRDENYSERHETKYEDRPKHRDEDIPEPTGGGDSSLSIDETNALRAKLGLKPLDQPNSKKSEEDFQTVTDRPDVHKPAVNLASIKKSDELREKMAQIKERRKINMKLGKVKTLGDSESDEESAVAWVKKTRKQQIELEQANKRAKLLEEMDEEFGVGGLIEEEFQPKKKKEMAYDSKNLTGLEVRHAQESFKEGKTIILTLEDQEILAEDSADRLVNVNMMDDERTAKNIQNKKKLPAYNPYDNTTVDEFGMLNPKEVLDKYDDEIYGAKKESFQLGKGGSYDSTHERRMQEIKTEFKERGEALTLPTPVVASEFYTTDEMAKFKKVKKKVRKIRKKTLKASDLEPIDDDISVQTEYGSRSRGRGYLKEKEEGELDEMEMEQQQQQQQKQQPKIPGLDSQAASLSNPMEEADIIGPEEDLSGIVIDDEAGQELESILHKTRKLKRRKAPPAPEEQLKKRGVEANLNDAQGNVKLAGNIVLNSTSEFCRALGEIPTYGLAGNREDEEDELMDFEQEDQDKNDMTSTAAGWQTVDIDTRPVDIEDEQKGGLEDEPEIDDGLASTLLLAKKKGFIEEEAGQKSRRINVAMVVDDSNYSIEDKKYDDLDDKSRKRDRYSTGITQDFKELKNYKPEFKLSYADESGRELNAKEAFRQLSHRFHGKGSGKRKTEKRGKKVAEENLMKSMSSTDTPLQTLKMLKDKQKAEHSAYVVLSGNKGFTGGASLSKP